MSSLARYANGASFIPFANSDTTTAKNAFGSTIDSFVTWTKARYHLLIQLAIFGVIVGSLGAHLALQNSQHKADILASQQLASAETVAVDKLSSSEVAAVVALTTDTLVADEVVATADKIDAGSEVTVASENFVSKPAAALTDDKSAIGVTKHKVAKGESLKEIAKTYGISVETLKWANSNISDIEAGDTLKIPPVNGVLYTVKDGDSAKEIAAKFDADADRIVAFNDAELTGFKAGQKIIIPGGEKQEESNASARSSSVSRIYAAAYAVTNIHTSGNVSFITNYRSLPASGGYYNSYSVGWCTHWAAFRAKQLGNPIPPMLGNAFEWHGPNPGRPRVGSVGRAGNHVVVVEAVKGNKIKYSDMNGLAGWGNAAKTDYWVPASNYVYIHY